MKKITLLVASIFLLGGGAANAAEKIAFSVETKSPVDFRNPEPIVFIERGIQFFIFPDGQLDFNTRPSKGGEQYYQTNSRGDVNRTYGAPKFHKNKNYGVKVAHDNMGRVRQVGNVFINYDSNDRVKRVGSVYMTYNRYALEQVGGLQIMYNRRGQIVDTVGNVNGGKGFHYNQNNYQNNDYAYEHNQNDNNDKYYYRSSNQNEKVNQNITVIKR